MVKHPPSPQRSPRQTGPALSEAVRKIINLATAIRRYWETELPKRHPDYPLMNAGEKAPPPPPQEKKLAELLNGLSKGQIYRIALLTDLGRGYFNVPQLSNHFNWLMAEFPDPNSLATQLAGNATLGDYLEAGLAELGKHQLDVDHLPLKAAGAHA